MNFKPLQDRILIKKVNTNNTTKSGIIIPDTAREGPLYGVVVAVGNGIIGGKKRDMSLKNGDKVIFTKWSGSEIIIDEKKYIIMRESDILGITL